jgi:transposase-like protein
LLHISTILRKLIKESSINLQTGIYMAGKLASMSTIKQVIQLHESGVSNRRIAKTLGLNKNTVIGLFNHFLRVNR